MTLPIQSQLGSRTVRGAAAFTLLEILLAVSLSLLLLAALYTALKLHLTFAQRGPDAVRKAQLARSIVERIARDVRAIIPPAPHSGSPDALATTSSSSSATGSSRTAAGSAATGSASASSQSPAATAGSISSDTTGSTTSSLETSPDAYRSAFGVLGGPDWLQLYIADYNPNLDDTEIAASSGSVAQLSNVVRVTYTLMLFNTQSDSKGRTQRLALARSQVASVAAEQLDTSGNDSDIRATTEYLCDDMAQLQFQYWDDLTGTWLDSWGWDMPIAPPRAIRVFVSLQDPERFLDSSLGLSGGQSTWHPNYQLVIPIATWDPDASGSATDSGATGGY